MAVGQDLLAEVASQGIVPALARRGLRPEAIKAAIVELFHPFIRDADLLEREATGVLAAESENLLRVTSDPWAFHAFKSFTVIYDGSAATDRPTSLRHTADREHRLERGCREYFSQFYLELPKADLPPDLFKHEIFRNIGTSLEAMAQPFLRDVLFHSRLRRRHSSCADVDQGTFGSVVDELCREEGLGPVLAFAPWDIPVHQWRNIAQHYSSEVREDEIVVTYGPENRRRTLLLSQAELMAVLQKVVGLCRAVRTARTLFIFNHLEEFARYLPEGEVRFETAAVCLASSLATQGFALARIQLRADTVDVVVQDLTDGEPIGRMAHCSQFVCPVWVAFPRAQVSVVYVDRAGLARLRVTAAGTDCDRVTAGSIELSAMLGAMTFERLA